MSLSANVNEKANLIWAIAVILIVLSYVFGSF